METPTSTSRRWWRRRDARDLALGLVAFGLGMLGLLKTAIEMREHHRIDRQPATEDAP